MRKNKNPVHRMPVKAEIEGLSHDGRGIARLDGKVVFVRGALPGETVTFEYRHSRDRFDEGQAIEIHVASPDRVEPPCPFTQHCAGCCLQHLAPEAQWTHKQATLAAQLLHMGKVTPETWLPPITGPTTGYRHKARLAVRYVIKKEKLLIGFHEPGGGKVSDIDHCAILRADASALIAPLKALLETFADRHAIAQIEVALGDSDLTKSLIFRNMTSLASVDYHALKNFCQTHGWTGYLQPAGPDSLIPLDQAPTIPLQYRLPAYDLIYDFEPFDFTQVNPAINAKMVDQALSLLQLEKTDSVLDLFCGLGNFTLPIARYAGAVCGVEFDTDLIARAHANAANNQLSQTASFHRANLYETFSHLPWAQRTYDKVLLDPPRSGAQAVVEYMAHWQPRRIVYVSCHAATLARDAGILVHQAGYRFVSAALLDMFPHTAHLEAMAVFEKI